ncbi:unnamed protein product [Gadus morhua 'NCC']
MWSHAGLRRHNSYLKIPQNPKGPPLRAPSGPPQALPSAPKDPKGPLDPPGPLSPILVPPARTHRPTTRSSYLLLVLQLLAAGLLGSSALRGVHPWSGGRTSRMRSTDRLTAGGYSGPGVRVTASPEPRDRGTTGVSGGGPLVGPEGSAGVLESDQGSGVPLFTQSARRKPRVFSPHSSVLR